MQAVRWKSLLVENKNISRSQYKRTVEKVPHSFAQNNLWLFKPIFLMSCLGDITDVSFQAVLMILCFEKSIAIGCSENN